MQVHFLTTGVGRWRASPNLYAEGKVGSTLTTNTAIVAEFNGCFVHARCTKSLCVRNATAHGGQFCYQILACSGIRFESKVKRLHLTVAGSAQVCLSLLGTWAGPGWDPGSSTILQVSAPKEMQFPKKSSPHSDGILTQNSLGSYREVSPPTKDRLLLNPAICCSWQSQQCEGKHACRCWSASRA